MIKPEDSKYLVFGLPCILHTSGDNRKKNKKKNFCNLSFTILYYKTIDRICPLAILNQIYTISMHKAWQKSIDFYSSYHLETNIWT